MRELSRAGRSPDRTDGEVSWVEHFRTPDLSIGTYLVPAGVADPQDPHAEDEIYLVTSGRGVLAGPDSRIEVSEGSVVFVAAGEQHHFEQVSEDLVLVVIFGPAEGSRDGSG